MPQSIKQIFLEYVHELADDIPSIPGLKDIIIWFHKCQLSAEQLNDLTVASRYFDIASANYLLNDLPVTSRYFDIASANYLPGLLDHLITNGDDIDSEIARVISVNPTIRLDFITLFKWDRERWIH